MNAPQPFRRSIHLLYVPTLFCNLGCRYCYLGEQTRQADLASDAGRAVATLEHALARLEEAGVLAFNVSLHGGEVTTLPPEVLDRLFARIRRHYLTHLDALTALGHRKSAPHIKTNLYRFAPLYALFERHQVSISASIDLPLALHERYRTTAGGAGWLERTLDNLRLLARYPHARKISATLSAEHLADPAALIDDIWFLHRDIGLDMNAMNLMFAFGSELNTARQGNAVLTPASEAQQVALYDALHAAFVGTELEEGLRRHWFDEFTPGYCTSAFNCGERFYLLQGDGAVYSCVRGQGLPEFHYGNVFEDSIDDILATGARKIAAIHRAHGFDESCQRCDHLPLCHTGCPVVKQQHDIARAYTCRLQRTIYRDAPLRFPAADPATRTRESLRYASAMHPASIFAGTPPAPPPAVFALPSDLDPARHALGELIAADPVLQALYRDDGWIVEINGESIPLASQILRQRTDWHTLVAGDSLRLHVRAELFEVACAEPVRNTLTIQILRDTPVVYGDEQRSKQEHLFTHQLFFRHLRPSPLGESWRMADLGALIHLHAGLYRHGVRNNCLVSTGFLRDYHYRKQQENAFYHLQAINLPFQNFEFHYLHDSAPLPEHE